MGRINGIRYRQRTDRYDAATDAAVRELSKRLGLSQAQVLTAAVRVLHVLWTIELSGDERYARIAGAAVQFLMRGAPLPQEIVEAARSVDLLRQGEALKAEVECLRH